MQQYFDVEAMIKNNLCHLSIVARLNPGHPYLLLIEEASGFEQYFCGLFKPITEGSLPGFSIGYGDETIGKIAACMARQDNGLRNHIVAPTPPGSIRLLVFYRQQQEPRITSADFVLDGTTLQ